MECLYCKTVLKTISSLNQHQKTAKYCLSKQQKKPEKQYECCFCNTGFTVKSALHSHLSICKANTPIIQEQLQELDIVFILGSEIYDSNYEYLNYLSKLHFRLEAQMMHYSMFQLFLKGLIL